MPAASKYRGNHSVVVGDGTPGTAMYSDSDTKTWLDINEDTIEQRGLLTKCCYCCNLYRHKCKAHCCIYICKNREERAQRRKIDALFDKLDRNHSCDECGCPDCVVKWAECICPYQALLTFQEAHTLSIKVCQKKFRHQYEGLNSYHAERFCDMVAGSGAHLSDIYAHPKKYAGLPKQNGKIKKNHIGVSGKLAQIDSTECISQERLVAGGNLETIIRHGKVTREEFYEIIMQATLVIQEDLFDALAKAYEKEFNENVKLQFDLTSNSHV